MPFYTQIHMLVVHEAVPARNAAELVVLALVSSLPRIVLRPSDCPWICRA